MNHLYRKKNKNTQLSKKKHRKNKGIRDLVVAENELLRNRNLAVDRSLRRQSYRMHLHICLSLQIAQVSMFISRWVPGLSSCGKKGQSLETSTKPTINFKKYWAQWWRKRAAKPTQNLPSSTSTAISEWTLMLETFCYRTGLTSWINWVSIKTPRVNCICLHLAMLQAIAQQTALSRSYL